MQDVEKRRRQIGWSQDELAAQAGVSTRTVWAAEHDRRISARSTKAIEMALSTGEQRRLEELAHKLSTPAGVSDVTAPKGVEVVDLSTPDGRVRIVVALDPDSDVDIDEVRQQLRRLHQQAVHHRHNQVESPVE